MENGLQFVKDQYYWIEDTVESYVAGRLLNQQPTQNSDYQFELYSTSQVVWINKSQVYATIPSPGEITLRTLYDDLTDAIDISEASVLWNLRQRYQIHNIYSAIGPILIAINPYCYLKDLYSQEKLDHYLNATGTDQVTTHIWAIARTAYLQLKEKYIRQAIVISGESGAGKTETTKKCLQYLSAASMGHNKAASAGQTAIEDRVLGSNPLLESFGNSKTCRNNNSSRFGKWLEINFNCGRGKFNLIGANITQYLLEKSRVVSQAEDERNYHVFYQMCSDETMGLGLPENYVYLNQSGCTFIDGVDDYQDFQETKKAFNDLHFPEEDQQAIFNALKAILYLGNLIFEEGQSMSGRCSILSPDTAHCLTSAAGLLGFDEEELTQALTTRTIHARGEVMVKPLDIEQAQDTKNAFVKEIYGRLFSYIVTHANKSLAFSTNNELESQNENRARSGKRRLSMQGGMILSIGLLDIFGFEIFTSNSFEQLCINYGNEKLQQYFINYVLKKEQETYEAEGISVERVETVDNQDVLHLLESKPFGVFAILDEELKLPQGSDSGFIKKVEKEYKEKSTRFKRDFRMQNEQFEIHHFAGKVLYSATNFLDKNKDKMYEHLETLLVSSKVVRFKEMMIQTGGDILPTSGGAGGGGGAGAGAAGGRSSGKHQRQLDTLASRFTGQLHQLITVLQESEPHFVRCIKPNNLKNPISFEPELVLRQLRYSGVLEAIQIRKSGYPTRKLLNDFFKSYRLLADIPLLTLNALPNDSERCAAVLQSLQNKNPIYFDMKLGKTMVFYRPDVHNSLENDKIQVGLRAILSLQSLYRQKKATERVQILWEARKNLRLAMTVGYEDQSSNITALSDLEYWLHYATQVRLTCYDVTEGQELSQRLHQVKSCLEQLESLLIHGTEMSHGDIILEFTALEESITQAMELRILHPILNQIMSRRDELRGRATAVLALRDAVRSLDEISLESCLENIESLIKDYGQFCERERENANDLLLKLKLELTVMNDVYSLLSDSQQLLAIAIEQEFGDHSATPSLEISQRQDHRQGQEQPSKEILSSSLANLTQLLSPLISPSGTYHHPLCSLPSKNIFKIIHLIQQIRSHWQSNDWTQIVETIIELTDSLQFLWPLPPDCLVTSEALQNITQLFVRVIENELQLIAQGVDVHVVLPMLNEGIENGRIQIQNYHDVSQISVNVEPLANAVEKVRKITTLGKKARALLELAETVLSCRHAAADDNYEMVLALTESSPITSCRYMRQKKLITFLYKTLEKKKLHKQSSVGFTLETLDDDDHDGEGEGEEKGERGERVFKSHYLTSLSQICLC